jgi:hypothetical protein
MRTLRRESRRVEMRSIGSSFLKFCSSFSKSGFDSCCFGLVTTDVSTVLVSKYLQGRV